MRGIVSGRQKSVDIMQRRLLPQSLHGHSMGLVERLLSVRIDDDAAPLSRRREPVVVRRSRLSESVGEPTQDVRLLSSRLPLDVGLVGLLFERLRTRLPETLHRDRAIAYLRGLGMPVQFSNEIVFAVHPEGLSSKSAFLVSFFRLDYSSF